jgi:hypothetical protein
MLFQILVLPNLDADKALGYLRFAQILMLRRYGGPHDLQLSVDRILMFPRFHAPQVPGLDSLDWQLRDDCFHPMLVLEIRIILLLDVACEDFMSEADELFMQFDDASDRFDIQDFAGQKIDSGGSSGLQGFQLSRSACDANEHGDGSLALQDRASGAEIHQMLMMS